METFQPADKLTLLGFLNQAVPLAAPRAAEPSLIYQDNTPRMIPRPPPPPPEAPLKHHRAPDVFAVPQRPVSARAAAQAARPAPMRRPYSARPGVTVAVAADTAASQNQASSQSSAAAAAIRPRPASAAATSAAGAALPAAIGDAEELHSAGEGDGGTPAAASPRAMRETWTPGVRAWSDWSVGNAAYPKLAERSSAAVAGPAARCRYAIIAADSPREHRFKPSKTPVTVKRSWGDAEYVPLAPVSAVPPPPPPSSRVRVVGAQGASTSTSGSQQEAAEGSVGADGGGGGVGGGKMGGGLSAMFGKAKHGKAKMSLKTLAKLSSTLTGVQARAQAKERGADHRGARGSLRLVAHRAWHGARLLAAVCTVDGDGDRGDDGGGAAARHAQEEGPLPVPPSPLNRHAQQEARGEAKHAQIKGPPRLHATNFRASGIGKVRRLRKAGCGWLW